MTVAGRIVRVAGVAVAVAGAVGLVLVLVFLASGGRWYVVCTPSMGTAAPVGSLMLTRPVDYGDIAVGDVLLFRPPNAAGETYGHRVVRIDPDGTLRTKGDLNDAVDTWTIGPANVVGRVQSVWFGAGWLVRGLPPLLIGALFIWLLTRMAVPARLRLPARVVLGALLASAVIVMLQPLVRTQLINQGSEDGMGWVRVVPTGVMAVDAHLEGGASRTLSPGQDGTLKSWKAGRDEVWGERFVAHVSTGWWVVFALVWSVPLLIALYAARRPPRPGPPPAAHPA